MRILERILRCIFGVDRNVEYQWKDHKLFEDKDLLDSRLVDCVCRATHNSYLTGLQIIGPASLDTFVEQLNIGVRCLELDIFKHIDSEDLVLTHGDVKKGIQATSYVYLRDTLALIRKFAFRNTTLPLILFTEFQLLDDRLYPKIHALFQKYFGDRIVYRRTIDSNVTLRELRGKVLIFCTNAHADYGKMEEYINPLPFKNVSSEHEAVCNLVDWNKNYLTRVYPKNIIMSSNYNTRPFFKTGCQIVSINFQTPERYTEIVFPEYCGFMKKNSVRGSLEILDEIED